MTRTPSGSRLRDVGGGVTASWLARGEAHLPHGFEWLGPWERTVAALGELKARGVRLGGGDRLDLMRFTKRRVEFLVARLAGKEAVAAATGTDWAEVEIRNGPGGAPYAFIEGKPFPGTITLTHRAGWGVGAVSGPGVGIGVDLEVVETRSRRFVTDYLTPAEQDAVGDDLDLAPNLVWAAKEAALKVLRTGLRRPPWSVEVAFETGFGWSPLVVEAIEGPRFDGWWRRFGHFVLVVVADRPIPIPISFEEPPRLAYCLAASKGTAA